MRAFFPNLRASLEMIPPPQGPSLLVGDFAINHLNAFLKIARGYVYLLDYSGTHYDRDGEVIGHVLEGENPRLIVLSDMPSPSEHFDLIVADGAMPDHMAQIEAMAPPSLIVIDRAKVTA